MTRYLTPDIMVKYIGSLSRYHEIILSLIYCQLLIN